MAFPSIQLQSMQTSTMLYVRPNSIPSFTVFEDTNYHVVFEFFQGNHSVVRAEYEHPCIPYEYFGNGRVGFFSGFVPVDGIPKENVRSQDVEMISVNEL
jgi:hypothetical protein